MQGFIIESDYEGDEGHPRVGLIQPGTAANDVLVQGDIILSINGASVATHADAAKAIKAVKTGDVMIKVLTKKPRGTTPALAAKEAALEADAEAAAATKMQATVRGNAARVVAPHLRFLRRLVRVEIYEYTNIDRAHAYDGI